VIDTGSLTTALVAALAVSSGELVGDGVAPTAGGWSNGQPNVGDYVPYGVLSFQGANPRESNLRYNEHVKTWITQWRIGYYGASREQADWVATAIRSAVVDLYGVGTGYTVRLAEWRSLGAMTRSDQVDPPLWSALDALTLQVAS